MQRHDVIVWPLAAVLCLGLAVAAVATPGVYDPNQELDSFRAHYQAPLNVEWDFSTGYVKYIRGEDLRLDWVPETKAEFEAAAREIFNTYPGLFGFDAQTLVTRDVWFINLAQAGSTDKVAVVFDQEIGGAYVFGARASVLFDHEGRLLAIQNRGVPDLQDNLDQLIPSVGESAAIARATEEFGHAVESVLGSEYVIFRTEIDGATTGRPAWMIGLRAGDSDEDGLPIQERLVIDAQTGAVLDHQSTIYTFTDLIGNTQAWKTPGDAPDKSGNPEQLWEVDTIRMSSSVGNANSDINGDWTIAYGGGSAQSVTASFNNQSKNCRVDDQGGSDYTQTQTVTPGVPADFELNTGKTQYDTAEMNAQEWVLNQLRYIWSVNSGDNTMNFKVRANVNINSSCNAYYDGVSINFFRAAGGCVNTAYSTVVSHEEGHYCVDRYLGGASGAFHEGNADIWGMYVADTNIVGRDFCGSGCHIRNGNNNLKKCSGNCTESCHGGESHTEGEVLMGAFWKMLSRLRTTNGDAQGKLIADALFIGWMEWGPDNRICDSIYTNILTLDDNDGNLNNGTPHCADIEGAFETDKGWPDLWNCSGGGGDPCPGNCSEPLNYGTGTAGSGGLTPHITHVVDNGCPYIGNQFFTQRVENALGGAPGVFFIGFGRDNVPSGGWTLLVDITPIGAIIPISYSGAGAGNGVFEIVMSIPNNPYILGLMFNTQATVADPGAPQGVAATEGLESTICDPNG